jgi:hypothetical protein
MTGAEMITDFVLRKDWWTCPLGAYNYHAEAKSCCEKNRLDPTAIVHTIVMSSVESLIKAINAYCKKVKVEAEEYHFTVSPSIKYRNPGELIPQKYAYLIAYAVEGNSEGYYVHVGAILKDESGAFGGQ